MILAGDIGGTHARVAIFDLADGKLRCVHEQVYPTHDFPNLESVVRAFLDRAQDRARRGLFRRSRPGDCESRANVECRMVD